MYSGNGAAGPRTTSVPLFDIVGPLLEVAMATKFEGNVAFVPNAEGVYQLKRSQSGNWNAKNIHEGVEAFIKAGASLSQWSLWLDFGKDFPRPEKPLTAKQLKAYLDQATDLELVLVRRPFPQPKLRLSNGAGNAPKTEVNGKPIL